MRVIIRNWQPKDKDDHQPVASLKFSLAGHAAGHNRHMELIQIFLPLRDNQGEPFPFRQFEEVKKRLLEKFGGVTAFLNSPAEGVWRESPKSFIKDDVVTFEVMSETLDRNWWNAYKEELEAGFRQEELIIRKMQIELL
jgi:hypothetical protein